MRFADQRRDRRLTDDEYRRLGAALAMAEQDVWQPAIAATRLMIITGWRRGEVLGLLWSEIDLARRTARLADTKTGASIRPLSEAACAVIGTQVRTGNVVFPTTSSSHMPIVGYRKMWLRIAKLGDLPADITPHVLRHSFASLAADLGFNEPTICCFARAQDVQHHQQIYPFRRCRVACGSRCRGQCHHEVDGMTEADLVACQLRLSRRSARRRSGWRDGITCL